MLDFVEVVSKVSKKDNFEVYPKFKICKSDDLMIRGGDFYAIWDPHTNLWSTDENVALDLIVEKTKAEYSKIIASDVYDPSRTKWVDIHDADAGIIDKWHKFCQKQMRDSWNQLDEKLIFANDTADKKDFASKKLPYVLAPGPHDAWDKIIGTLYSPEERQKIEWAIGAIVTGDSKNIQKFLVFYGGFGTGKSTILKIISHLFEGYCSTFDSRALGSASNAFALEAFKTNPLVAIQNDGDLSRIEDNARINSLVSHETMLVNEKFRSAYPSRFNTFLLMGTNKPVKITDAKSGLLRRLIDVSPSGNKIPQEEYFRLIRQTDFELGAIAWHCREVYVNNKHLYDEYRPLSMMSATNDFYLFVYDKYYMFKEEDQISLNDAWKLYKDYCEDAKVQYMYPLRQFREELKNYFCDFQERAITEDGRRVRSVYSGFRTEKFNPAEEVAKTEQKNEGWLEFDSETSIFDEVAKDYPAQYAKEDGSPMDYWDKVTTKLCDIQTSELHYVRVPENHIVIDLDIPDDEGNKCYAKNLEFANKFPKTYAELSKSGQGIHLHYMYEGNVDELSRLYAEHVEIKVFNGKSSLRRKLTKCNRLPIATINSGLPKKEVKKVLDDKTIRSEKKLREMIERNLRKEFHPDTTSSINFIKVILDNAYESELSYDVSDMINIVTSFAMQSTHGAEKCMKQVAKMKWKSKEREHNPTEELRENLESPEYEKAPILFFDVEVFPNLLVICWKKQGKDNPVVGWINPKPMDVLKLTHYRLIGFNNRKYDNHILYARIMGWVEQEIYNLSQDIIAGVPSAMFQQARGLSYTDIFDFSSTKQSLKKFEIEIGIHHQELGLAWDQPVDPKLWDKVVEYCKNDVIATEATFDYLNNDWFGREMLVKMANKLCKTVKSTVNDTTNTLTTRLVFGGAWNPQSAFNYRDLSKPVRWSESMREHYRKRLWPIFDDKGQPTYQRFDPDNPIELPEGWSIMPFFPGYDFDATRKQKSLYLGQEVGEGGRVFAVPGMYGHVLLNDIASMHPSTMEAEDSLGPEYTQRFADLKQIRIDLKHGDLASAKSRLGGALAELFESENFDPDKLSKVLKIPINAVYGQTAAHFKNAFRDDRNVDNLVAKRGALFMMNLEQEVKKRGFTVAHVKTDSIKVPDYTDEILDFINAYGAEYGYTFEHEATYDKMCLVNNAVYVARYEWAEKKSIKPGTWTATGTQFKIPYVFKSLFSHEPLAFKDFCITQESKVGALYLNFGGEITDEIPSQSGYLQGREVTAEAQTVDMQGNVISEAERIKMMAPDLRFVGKVGQFTPVVQGGGELLAQRTDKKTGKITYAAAPGSTGYRWMESEVLRNSDDPMVLVDMRYFKALADAAVTDISKYGGFDWFVSDVPYNKNYNEIFQLSI